MSGLNRRRVLRGMLNGGAITVGIPLLNCFLNSNGNAMADGSPMPLRFGTWFWGCGMNEKLFVPKKIGVNEVPPLKWSILRYGFSKEDHDGKKEAYGGRDRCEVATG